MNSSEQEEVKKIYQEWYAGVDKNNKKEGWGAICGGITIVENLMSDYVLDLGHHQTEGGTQLQKAGPALGQKVLRRFDINVNARLGEFGRTSRGGPPAAARLMILLEPLHLERLNRDERNDLLLALQKYVTYDLVKLLERNTQAIYTQPTDTFEKVIGDLLLAVPKISSGAVAQHLVGAKLTLRFPHLHITNDVTAAADAPTKRPGDFTIGTTSFHITLSPQDPVFQKCIENLNQGYDVYLLVSERTLEGAKRKAEQYHIRNKIIVKSIESFIAQNIDEIGQFSKEALLKQKEELIRVYNQRIQDANERYAPFLSLDGDSVEIKDVAAEEEKHTYTVNSLFDLQEGS